MRVIAKPRLRRFWEEHKDAQEPLSSWWKVSRRSDWRSIRDVRLTYPHADAVLLDCGLQVTVFNVGGNKYRLVTRIIYEHHRIYIKAVLTHAQYARGKWKVQLCRE